VENQTKKACQPEKSVTGFIHVTGYGRMIWLAPDYSADLLRSDLNDEFAGGHPGFQGAVGLPDLGQWVAPVDPDMELSVAY
jgi:hypothetical protein